MILKGMSAVGVIKTAAVVRKITFAVFKLALELLGGAGTVLGGIASSTAAGVGFWGTIAGFFSGAAATIYSNSPVSAVIGLVRWIGSAINPVSAFCF